MFYACFVYAAPNLSISSCETLCESLDMTDFTFTYHLRFCALCVACHAAVDSVLAAYLVAAADSDASDRHTVVFVAFDVGAVFYHGVLKGWWCLPEVPSRLS